ncbi:hypothetical protein ACOMHN_004174 [Nucella lapillus]
MQVAFSVPVVSGKARDTRADQDQKEEGRQKQRSVLGMDRPQRRVGYRMRNQGGDATINGHGPSQMVWCMLTFRTPQTMPARTGEAQPRNLGVIVRPVAPKMCGIGCCVEFPDDEVVAE